MQLRFLYASSMAAACLSQLQQLQLQLPRLSLDCCLGGAASTPEARQEKRERVVHQVLLVSVETASKEKKNKHKRSTLGLSTHLQANLLLMNDDDNDNAHADDAENNKSSTTASKERRVGEIDNDNDDDDHDDHDYFVGLPPRPFYKALARRLYQLSLRHGRNNNQHLSSSIGKNKFVPTSSSSSFLPSSILMPADSFGFCRKRNNTLNRDKDQDGVAIHLC